MKTNKIYRKLLEGGMELGVDLSAKECRKLVDFVLLTLRENVALKLEIVRLKRQIAADDSGSYDSLIPDWAYWIKFKDRLPEEGQHIIAVDKETKTILGFIFTKPNVFRDYLVSNYDYWMPLPELPEVQE